MSKRKTSNRDWAEEAVDMETLVQWDGRGECDHLNLYGRHVTAMFDDVKNLAFTPSWPLSSYKAPTNKEPHEESLMSL